jgi:hypothetical protein
MSRRRFVAGFAEGGSIVPPVYRKPRWSATTTSGGTRLEHFGADGTW